MQTSEEKLSEIISNNKQKVAEILSNYQDLSIDEKYRKLNKELDSLIIDIKGENIDVILDYTSSIFIQIGIHISNGDQNEIMNKLAKLYHKLKNLHFFNIMIFLFRKIESVSEEINKSYSKNEIKFEIINDIILNTVYPYDQNIFSEYKSLSLNIKSTNGEKFEFLCSKLEEIDIKEDVYKNFILVRGDYDEGYMLKLKMNDNYLILNKNLEELNALLKNYGMESNDWDELGTRKPWNSLSDEEKKEKDELKKKKAEEKEKKTENLYKALIIQENFIKNNFKNTKKNTKLFKHIFFRLVEIITSNEEINNKILKILPYGSVTQCTCNEASDLEMTILTKNYKECNEEFIQEFFEKIIDYIREKKFSEFELYLEGIRHTKRTILLLLIHKETNTKIEINCNNFFSIMNSNLIRNYLTYDARALILINTIKDWSKKKEVNSNGKFYLSSYCFTLMTIFFLQRIKNPLLPIISSHNKLIKMKIAEKEHFIEKELVNTSDSMKNWHTENKEDTVVTLLLKWMIFYLYLFNNDEYFIDISSKKLCYRLDEAKYLTFFVRNDSKRCAYCFIDMFDYTYNPGGYMSEDSPEYNDFREEMKKAIKMILEGKVEFFLAK